MGNEGNQTGYRRNQTRSGVKKGVDPNSPRNKVHSLADKRRKVGLGFTISAFVAILLAILLFQLIGSVKIVNGSTGLTRGFASKEAEYIKAVDSYFGSHPVERLKFMLNEDSLTNYIGGIFTEVKSVSLAKESSISEVGMVFVFRQPVASWQIKNDKYYVDDSGVVFQENYYNSPEVSIVDESGVTPDSGSPVASGKLLGFVGRVVADSQGRGYTVSKVVLPEGSTRRVDVSFNNVRPVVRFTVDRGAGEQVSDADRAIRSIGSQASRYIDVRVGGRAVYR